MRGPFYPKELFRVQNNRMQNAVQKQALVGAAYPALDEPSPRSVWLALLLNTMPETMHQQTENQDPM
jgi:hypothetical protein